MEEKICLEEYENIYENKFSHLLREEELDVEVKRLLNIRKSITKLKNTIELPSTAPSKRTNLLIALQNLHEEEKLILSRMELLDSPNSILKTDTTNTNTNTTNTQTQNKGVPDKIWNSLLPFQKVGVSWMLNIILKGGGGGILADEMGLGKTIQTIALISSLHCLNLLHSKVIIICPATIMEQWAAEITKWYPSLSSTIVHPSHQIQTSKSSTPNIIITSYGQCLNGFLDDLKATLVVLDEGHRIRNPETEISSRLRRWAHAQSSTRIILSGTPIQNNLQELWSLIDFCVPGKLGSLKTFMDELAIPIQKGGLVTSSSLQVETSYRCACTLRSLIDPLILRRLKTDVLKDILPEKSENVLLCSLTEYQRTLYKNFLQSEKVNQILSGQRNVLAGIDSLRKICNDPRLYDNDNDNDNDISDDQKDHQSSKLVMLKGILEEWKRDGNRVLIFCQTRQMLNIIEKMINKLSYSYLRMDGNTPLRQRDGMVDLFNNSTDIFIFLLTTKVGGLGINLTGADRIIIYDPDWNPSTDVQARERAWRLGQNRKVIINRFLTRGTIEEKIYHRQIFKQYLTNRILSDPKQGRFFKSVDLYDLFVLDEDSRIIIDDDHHHQQHQESRDIFSIPHDKEVECPRPEKSLLIREAKRRADLAFENIKKDSLLEIIKKRKEGFGGGGGGGAIEDDFISSCKTCLSRLFLHNNEPSTQEVMDCLEIDGRPIEWTEERKYSFRALLKKMAYLKGGSGSIWKARK